MIEKLNLTKGLIFSQEVMLELTKSGLSREESYKMVQKYATQCFAKNLNLFENSTSKAYPTAIFDIKNSNKPSNKVVNLKNLGPSIVIKLEIAFINVSIELITRTNTRISSEILKAKLLPLNGSKRREKKIVLGSTTLSVATASIPKKPKINIKGTTIKKEDINPILRSLILLAA